MAAAAQTIAEPALLRAYLDACYRIGAGANAVDLTIGGRFPFPPRANTVHALVTACNPGSAILSDAQNDARMAQLASRVEELDLSAIPAVGGSRDGAWREPSLWLADANPVTVDALAAEFGQNACVVVDATGTITLRVYRDDWKQAAADDPRIQWPTSAAAT